MPITYSQIVQKKIYKEREREGERGCKANVETFEESG